VLLLQQKEPWLCWLLLVVLVVVVSPGTGENEFGEEQLTLMSAAALTDGSITVTVIEKSGKMTETES